MFQFKIDVMQELKNNDINTTKIRKDNIIGQKTLADIKKGIVPGIKVLDILCDKLHMDIGDIIKHVPDQEGVFSAEKPE